MARTASSLELLLPPRAPGAPARRWLYSALRTKILDGTLRPGTRLPGTRELATHYALSRGTVVAAFEDLTLEGYLEGASGSGTVVRAVLPEQWLQTPSSEHISRGAAAHSSRGLSEHARRVRPLAPLEVRPSRAFRANLPALDLFPMKMWRQVTARALKLPPTEILLGADPMGYGPLRRAVADYLNASRGVNCRPEQVAIVSGVQDALDLVSRLFLNPGDKVCMEDPGYPGASTVFHAHGAEVAPLALDAEGAQLPGLGLQNAKLVYVTPAHQFPLGMAMSMQRRLDLLGWASRSGTLIFEDDYDSEFRYSGSPLPALQGLDRHGSVLFAGSFSKVLFPSLRLGYLVVPADLVDLFAHTKSITSRHPRCWSKSCLPSLSPTGTLAGI